MLRTRPLAIPAGLTRVSRSSDGRSIVRRNRHRLRVIFVAIVSPFDVWSYYPGTKVCIIFLNWGNFWNTLILRPTCRHRIFFFFYISFLFSFPRFCFSIFRRETHRRSDGIHYRPEAWASLLVFMAGCWQAVCVINLWQINFLRSNYRCSITGRWVEFRSARRRLSKCYDIRRGNDSVLSIILLLLIIFSVGLLLLLLLLLLWKSFTGSNWNLRRPFFGNRLFRKNMNWKRDS